MKTAIVVFLLFSVTAVIFYGRQLDSSAPAIAPAPVDAAAKAIPDNDGCALEVPQKAALATDSEAADLIQQLCLPGTYVANDGSIDMNNIPASVGEFEASLAGLRQRLAVSNDAEHLLTAALLSDTPAEQLALAERALRTMPNDANLLHRAIGIAAAIKPDDRRLTMCSRASGNDDWLDACLRYGKLAERQGLALLTRAFGLGIQKQALQVTDDADGQAAVAARQKALSSESMPPSDRQGAQLLVVQADAGIQQSFLETWVQAGESAANAYLDDDLNRRLETGERIDCTGL